MKLLIDSGLKATAQDGIGNYFRRLVDGLRLAVPSTDLQIQPDGLWTRRLSWPPFGLRKLLYLGWSNSVLPRLIQEEQINVLHSVNMSIPLRRLPGCATVLTIYDLTYLRFPETIPPHYRLYYRLFIPTMVQRADHLIAISEFTKSELVTLLDVPESKITVTYLASKIDLDDHALSNDSDTTAILNELEFNRDFILTVGTIEPRKNLARLIEAFSLAVQCNQIDLDLVIVGAKGWLATPTFRQLAQSPSASRIKFLGPIPEALLAKLYQTAAFLVYPSLYEGFGLPVLEAMSVGTPVITSNQSSLPEIAGDAALLVDPHSIESISRAITKLAQDHHLLNMLSNEGRSRSKSFSWSLTAQQTIAVYEKFTN